MIGPEITMVTTVITTSPSKTGSVIILACRAIKPKTISCEPRAFIPNATAIDSFLVIPLIQLPIRAPISLAKHAMNKMIATISILKFEMKLSRKPTEAKKAAPVH